MFCKFGFSNPTSSSALKTGIVMLMLPAVVPPVVPACIAISFPLTFTKAFPTALVIATVPSAPSKPAIDLMVTSPPAARVEAPGDISTEPPRPVLPSPAVSRSLPPTVADFPALTVTPAPITAASELEVPASISIAPETPRLSPVEIVTFPVLISLLPVVTTASPLVPVPPVPEVTETFPPLVAPAPPVIVTVPPPTVVDLPAAMDKTPAVPTASPTESLMLPPTPAATPVDRSTLPTTAFPEPVANLISPEVIDAPVPSSTFPLTVVDAALVAIILPLTSDPSSIVDLPLVSSIAPPARVLLSPADNTILPAVVAALATERVILPPAPATPVPVEMAIDPASVWPTPELTITLPELIEALPEPNATSPEKAEAAPEMIFIAPLLPAVVSPSPLLINTTPPVDAILVPAVTVTAAPTPRVETPAFIEMLPATPADEVSISPAVASPDWIRIFPPLLAPSPEVMLTSPPSDNSSTLPLPVWNCNFPPNTPEPVLKITSPEVPLIAFPVRSSILPILAVTGSPSETEVSVASRSPVLINTCPVANGDFPVDNEMLPVSTPSPLSTVDNAILPVLGAEGAVLDAKIPPLIMLISPPVCEPVPAVTDISDPAPPPEYPTPISIPPALPDEEVPVVKERVPVVSELDTAPVNNVILPLSPAEATDSIVTAPLPNKPAPEDKVTPPPVRNVDLPEVTLNVPPTLSPDVPTVKITLPADLLAAPVDRSRSPVS